MPLKFKTGDQVRQVVPKPFEGVVTDAGIVDGEVQFKVDAVDGEGNEISRFFSEDQIEPIAP